MQIGRAFLLSLKTPWRDGTIYKVRVAAGVCAAPSEAPAMAAAALSDDGFAALNLADRMPVVGRYRKSRSWGSGR